MTSILDLAQSDGLNPKRKTANEYAGSCPFCGGTDRFNIFLATNSYWCRQCLKKGDAIQYLIDYRGMSFPEAAQAEGKELKKDWKTNSKPTISKPTTISNKATEKPQSDIWKTKVKGCIKHAHSELLKNDEILQWLRTKRGITRETVEKFSLGWLDNDDFRKKEEWGLEPGKKLYFPSGLVIPWQESRIRIRRDNPGEYPRYYNLPGSKNTPFLIGDPHETTAIIVESDLDAFLVSQEIYRTQYCPSCRSTCSAS